MPKRLIPCFVRLCWLIVLLVSLMRANAQSNRTSNLTVKDPIANQFEHLSVEDGLSNDFVTAILQDRDGFMWFGTSNGLNKYDGADFTIFKPDPSQPTRSFQSSYITGLCEGDSTQLWAITQGGGLHEINRKTGLVTPHSIQAPRANRWNNQLSVYQDSQHAIWVSTFAGLARYDPVLHRFTLYPSPVADAPVITVFEDRQQRFWVATHQGLFHFDRATGHFTPIAIQDWQEPQPSFKSFYLDEQNVLWLGTSAVGYSLFKLNLDQQPWMLRPYHPGGQLNNYVWHNTLHRDAKGIVWMGTTTGLQGIDPLTHQIFTYRSDPGQYKGLSSSSAQAVYHDRSGMLWVGTDNGIDRQAANAQPFITYQVKANAQRASVPENRAFAIFKDQRGQLWFNNSPALYRLSADQKRLDRIPPVNLGTSGQHANEVTDFLPDGPNSVWMGSFYGLHHHDLISGKFTGYPSEIPAQFIATLPGKSPFGGHIWIGGDGGFASFNPRTHQYTYYKYQPGNPNGIPDKDVYGLLVSQSGEVWLLIHRLGLCRFNPRTGRMMHYTAGPPGQLSSNDVRTIYEDQDGIIWIGAHRGGLNRFDPKTGRFTTITHHEGIPGTTIIGITGDASGQLWLTTPDGLCRYNPRTRAIHTYTVSDGLPTNKFKHNAVYRRGNELIFGTENGIVQFDPARIVDDTRPFPVYITGLTVLDQPRMLTDRVIRLKHNENLLSISFAALAYEQPRQNQYAYQLTGINKEWVQNGNRTSVNFTSLPPGTYRFRVKAANSNGFWSPQVASLKLIVLPPWWATWWAYSLYFLLLGGTIGGYIRFSTHRIRQRQELALNRRQAEQLKALDELKTHFFSNIAHEFRTPLSLIIAPVEKLLEQKRFDEPTLTLVHHNAQHLLRLTNQLLDLARLEGHSMPVTLRRGRVIDVIDPLVAVFQRAAEQNGILFTCELDENLSFEYEFDADKWEKILMNLLANALKFTEAGGRITLMAASVGRKEDMTAVQFDLVDTGIGIAPEQVPYIFDRFYQADSSTTRAQEGTGLGLALVHELIQLLGGTINVKSQVGEGTSFHWTLPVERLLADVVHSPGHQPRFELPVSVSQASTEPAFLPHQRGEQDTALPCILIVEDNEELREFLVGELASSYQILQAVDGQQGWEVIQAELPDIVLTDVMMPRRDGHELCRLVKGHAETDHIAVVMLTAKATHPSRMQGLQEGADEYLSKPFSVAELHLRLRNLLTRQQRLRERFQQQFITISVEEREKVETNPFLQQIYDLLDARLDNPQLGVEWLADQLAMSRRTLHRKVSSLTPWTPNELIRHYRARKGAELLLAGHNVAETADRVGFSTPSHFTLAFKEVYQQTPTEFMASQKKNA